MSAPSDLTYNFTLSIDCKGLRNKQHTITAHNIGNALRQLMFREFPSRPTAANLALADSIYENHQYQILTQAPIYGDIFRTEKDPNWKNRGGPTLRDIAEDMEDMKKIKDGLATATDDNLLEENDK